MQSGIRVSRNTEGQESECSNAVEVIKSFPGELVAGQEEGEWWWVVTNGRNGRFTERITDWLCSGEVGVDLVAEFYREAE